MKTKRIITLALAAALILALGVGAYATGAAQSVIAEIARLYIRPTSEETRSQNPEAAAFNDNRNSSLEALIELGEYSDKTVRRVDLENGAAITLTESYYDGEQLALSYTLDTDGPSVDDSFGPDHEFFALLQESEGLLWYQDLPTSEYLKIMSKLKLSGKVGLIIRNTVIGDHITLADGTDIGPFMGVENDGHTVLVPQNGLPESAKNRESLELVFPVKTSEAYIWLEGSKVYSYYPVVQGTPVTFTIANRFADNPPSTAGG